MSVSVEVRPLVSRFADPAWIRDLGGTWTLADKTPARLRAKGDEFRERIRADAAKRFGGQPPDYAVLFVTDAQALEGMAAGDAFSVAWTDEAAEPAVTFDVENAKFEAQFSSDAAVILANGSQTATVTVEIRRRGDGRIANVSRTLTIPVLHPRGHEVHVDVAIDSGRGAIAFKCSRADAGEWTFPGPSFADDLLARLRPQFVARVIAKLGSF